ncbi:hypothetical protein [Telmatospirillum sp.]|uniref:PepSY domain-containing protein n=1 Tax=Telmatospirillum sp. TaxID=2079197 RepID=UPI0028499C97|nr:hypothetical protein [Telmatospirillum sp.]MDR3437799.1 hypothetical protein [Telmatospirillum sp.]
MFSASLALADAEEHDRARQALAVGDIVPLHQMLARVASRYDGTVLDVDLDGDRKHGWTYWIRLLAPGGHVVDLGFDARTMAPLPAERSRHRGETGDHD